MDFKENQTMFIFKNEQHFQKNGKDQTFFSYSSNLSKKLDNGEYERMPVRVTFTKELKEKCDKGMKLDVSYKVDVIKSFLSFEFWTDKEGKKHYIPLIIISEYKLLEKKDVQNNKTNVSAEDLF